ncbi:perlucin-like [Ylistrum balloti]|uniref:perlucin-like n=1 Tax=Ylistrum balloti TaxID=509963 RepID=UPI002905DE69|nr:perlucin-like [Ylistrum balloti]
MDVRIVIVFIISALCAKRGFACRQGWESNGTLCYLFSHGKSTWAEASATCLAIHSHLAVITSDMEQTFLTGELNQLHQNGTSHVQYWIDGTDLEVENVWRWAITGDKLTYTAWADGEPNNAQGGNCMNLWGRGGFLMADDDCELHLNYICQETDREESGNIIG